MKYIIIIQFLFDLSFLSQLTYFSVIVIDDRLIVFLSTIYNIIPITIKVIAIIIIFKFISSPIMLSDILSNIILKIPAGIVAATKYQNILPSFESSFFTAFL